MLRLLPALVLLSPALNLLAAADVPASLAPADRGGSPVLDARVTVCLEPGSVVRRDIFARGMVTADELFKRVGVRLKWSCGNGFGDRAKPDGRIVRLRIEDEVPSDVSGTAIAYARPYARSGVNVVILWRRFQPLLSNHPDSAGIIFGHVMAHELGHVLSRSDYHGLSGLMSAKWTENDFQLMETQLLPFSPVEGKFIRDGLRSLKEQDAESIGAPPAPVVLRGPQIQSFR